MFTNTKLNLQKVLKQAILATLPIFLLVAPCFLRADAIHVSEQDGMRAVVTKVAPQYPPIARQLNLAGHVVIDMFVTPDGAVEKADIVAGNPILGGAAANAAKRWKFQPFTANGKPSEAIVRIGFDFVK